MDMQAIGFRRYGDARVLESLRVPIPALGPEQVLVRVAAAGVNPADWVMRRGDLRWIARLRFPAVPGLDIAGVITAVGSQVRRWRVGDRVFAMLDNLRMGGYAEAAAVDQSALALVPDRVSLTEAASVPCAALTALQALRDYALITPGMQVLVNGASGGVGTFAVQMPGSSAHVSRRRAAHAISRWYSPWAPTP